MLAMRRLSLRGGMTWRLIGEGERGGSEQRGSERGGNERGGNECSENERTLFAHTCPFCSPKRTHVSHNPPPPLLTRACVASSVTEERDKLSAQLAEAQNELTTLSMSMNVEQAEETERHNGKLQALVEDLQARLEETEAENEVKVRRAEGEARSERRETRYERLGTRRY